MMFTLLRLTRALYVVCLAALILPLATPPRSNAQVITPRTVVIPPFPVVVPFSRAPTAPFLGLVDMMMQPSLQQAQFMLFRAGAPLMNSGGLGNSFTALGGGFAGFGGFPGFGGGFGGGFAGFSGFGGFPGGFGGGLGGFPGGFGGGFGGFPGFGGGLGALGGGLATVGLGGFAGKGFGGFNGGKGLE